MKINSIIDFIKNLFKMCDIILIFGEHIDKNIENVKKVIDKVLSNIPKRKKIYTIIEYGGPPIDFVENEMRKGNSFDFIFNFITDMLNQTINDWNNKKEPDLSKYIGSKFHIEVDKYLLNKGAFLILENTKIDDFKEFYKKEQEFWRELTSKAIRGAIWGAKPTFKFPTPEEALESEEMQFPIKKRDENVLEQIKELKQRDENCSIIIVRGIFHEKLFDNLKKEGFKVKKYFY